MINKQSVRQQFKILLISIVALSIFGLLQFIVCTAIAIFNFPDGYSFAENFLSELGLLHNDLHALFNGSLLFLGFSLIPMFVLLWFSDPENSISVQATSIFGVISSVGIMGAGMWSFDRHFILHHVAMAMWLFPMLYMVITFFYAASKSPYVGIGFIATSLVMVVTMIYVLTATQTTSVQLLQRAIVVCGLIWICFIVAFIYQVEMAILKAWKEPDDSQEEKEKQYFARLNQGKRRTE